MTFACPCGEVFRDDAYPYRITYRQIVATHLERCTMAPTVADPERLSPRTVRPATGVELSPAPPVATHVDRLRGGFVLFVACPVLWIAGAWATARGVLS